MQAAIPRAAPPAFLEDPVKNRCNKLQPRTEFTHLSPCTTSRKDLLLRSKPPSLPEPLLFPHAALTTDSPDNHNRRSPGQVQALRKHELKNSPYRTPEDAQLGRAEGSPGERTSRHPICPRHPFLFPSSTHSPAKAAESRNRVPPPGHRHPGASLLHPQERGNFPLALLETQP